MKAYIPASIAKPVLSLFNNLIHLSVCTLVQADFVNSFESFYDMKVIIPVLIFLISLLFAPLIIPDPPVSDDITKLPASIQSWHKIGGYMKIGQYELFFIHKECKLKVNAPTFVIIHGYPSSSFEYHKVRRILVASTVPSEFLASANWPKIKF